MPRVFRLVLALSLLLAVAVHAQNFDLVVTLDAPGEVRPGEPFVLRGTVRNTGPDGVSAITAHFGASEYYPRCVEGLHIDVLQAGESRDFECAITPRIPPFVIRPFIQATTVHREADQSNNVIVKTTKILTPPQLELHPNTGIVAKPGLPFALSVIYANRAAYPATGATLTVDAPSGIARAPEHCPVTGTRAVCDLGTIEPNASGSLDIELTAPDISEHAFTATATIAANEGDVSPANNTYVFPLRTFRTFFVTNTADSGSGSLRAAIGEVNANCEREYPWCLVAFRIPPNAQKWQTINVTSPLPAITAPGYARIDATTQGGYFGDTNPLGPEIELTGSVPAGNGLEVVAPSTAPIQGLAINNFPGAAVLLRASASVIESYLGTDPTGSRAVPNGRGIVVEAPGVVHITKNVISGNLRSGIFAGRAPSIQILENVIGLNAAVTAGLGNGASGIYLSSAANNATIKDNHIGFNGHFGIAVDPSTRETKMSGNSFQANGQTAIDYGLDAVPALVPQITSARFEDGVTIIEGIPTDRGNFGVDVTLFANDAPDPSGFGEGQYLLGNAAASSGRFVFRYHGDLRGKWVTAVQTKVHVPLDRAEFTTSEFSRAVEVR